MNSQTQISAPQSLIIRVLLIEGNPGDARLIQEMLAGAEGVLFDLECTDRLSSGLERLAEGGIDVVLLGLLLPDSNGFDTFLKVQEHAAALPIVVLTTLDSETLALKTVQAGAQDYLVKGETDEKLLARSICYAIERKRVEEELCNLNEMNKRVVVMAAHELQTPLTAIQGYAGLLRDGKIGSVSPKQQETLDIIGRNSRRLSSLVSTFLNLEKLEAGKRHLDRCYFPLEELLTEVEKAFRPKAREKGLELQTALERSLLVCGSRDQLAQVFSNLVSNAIRFSDSGTVCIKARRAKDRALVEVADQGQGIPEQDLPHIFEEFYQVHHPSSGKPKEGTGLGLAIAKAIAEEHEGTIEVRSKLDQGSTFSVTLPLAPDRRKPTRE